MRFLSKLLAASGLILSLMATALVLSVTTAGASVLPVSSHNCHVSWIEIWGPVQTKSHITDPADHNGWTKHEILNCTTPPCNHRFTHHPDLTSGW